MVKISALKGVLPTKIFQQYQIDRRKSHFANVVTFVPKQEIRAIMRRAHATGELTPQLFEKALIRMIDCKAYDRAQIMIRCWDEELNLEISPIHAQMALNLSVQTKHWQDALHWWKAIQDSGKVTVTAKLYTLILKALRQSGDWKNTLAILNEIQMDGISCSAHARHAALLALRENSPWRVALGVVVKMFPSGSMHNIPTNSSRSITDELNFGKIGTYSSDLTRGDHEINAHVRTEAVHIITRAVSTCNNDTLNMNYSILDQMRAKSLYRNAWQFAFEMYYSVVPSLRTTALQNACIEVASRTRHWVQALQMLGENIQTSRRIEYHRCVTPETLQVCIPCLKEHPAQLFSLLEVGLQRNVPIPRSFLEALFLCILFVPEPNKGTDRSNGVIELFRRLRSVSFQNTSSCIGYHALCEATCDALLKSTDPITAFQAGRLLKPCLENDVLVFTDNLSSFGSELCIEVVDGRVAVLDGTTGAMLQANRLGEFFDVVALPYCVIRERVDFLQTLRTTPSQFHLRHSALKFIKSVRSSNLGKRLKILSFLSQLRSQMYLYRLESDGNVSVEKSQVYAQEKIETNAQESVTPAHGAQSIIVRGDTCIVDNEVAIKKWIHHGNHKERYIRLKAFRIFAAAFSLQSLNFDADVCLITRSQQNATLFQELKKIVATKLGKHRKLPHLLLAHTEKDIADFVYANLKKSRLRDHTSEIPKCGHSCRIMTNTILQLNI